MITAKRYLITGRVQGVGFRYFTLELAQKYGIVGRVRNLSDGRVEVQAQGDEDNVTRFYSELRIGPRLSRISDIRTEDTISSDELRTFSID